MIARQQTVGTSPHTVPMQDHRTDILTAPPAHAREHRCFVAVVCARPVLPHFCSESLRDPPKPFSRCRPTASQASDLRCKRGAQRPSKTGRRILPGVVCLFSGGAPGGSPPSIGRRMLLSPVAHVNLPLQLFVRWHRVGAFNCFRIGGRPRSGGSGGGARVGAAIGRR